MEILAQADRDFYAHNYHFSSENCDMPIRFSGMKTQDYHVMNSYNDFMSPSDSLHFPKQENLEFNPDFGSYQEYEVVEDFKAKRKLHSGFEEENARKQLRITVPSPQISEVSSSPLMMPKGSPFSSPSSFSKNTDPSFKAQEDLIDLEDFFFGESLVDSDLNSLPSTSCKYPLSCDLCMKGPPPQLLKPQSGWREILIYCFEIIKKANPATGKWVHVPSDIFGFIEDHWNVLCPNVEKGEIHWKKKIQDTLSHNKNYFVSGKTAFEKTGYWCLKGEDSESSPEIPSCSPPRKSRKGARKLSLTEDEKEDIEVVRPPEKGRGKVKPAPKGTVNLHDIAAPLPGCSPRSVEIPTPFYHAVRDFEEIKPSTSFVRPDDYIKFHDYETELLDKCVKIHEKMEERRLFWRQLNHFWSKNGLALQSYPYVGCVPLDLFSFFKEVTKHGGYQKISPNGKWSPTWESIYQKLLNGFTGPFYDPLQTNELFPLTAGDIRTRRLKFKKYYEDFLLEFEDAQAFLESSKISERSGMLVRCVCGHTHKETAKNNICVTCDGSSATGAKHDHILCESCGAWQHVSCLLEEQMITPSHLNVLESEDFHYYCEMCTGQRTLWPWSDKIFNGRELPEGWTCERKLNTDGRSWDYFIFEPCCQTKGRSWDGVITSLSDLDLRLCSSSLVCYDRPLKKKPEAKTNFNPVPTLPAASAPKQDLNSSKEVKKVSKGYDCVCGLSFASSQQKAAHCQWCNQWLVERKRIKETAKKSDSPVKEKDSKRRRRN